MHQFSQNKLPCRFRHYFSHPSDRHTHSTRHAFSKNISLLLKPKDPLNTSVQRSGMTFH